MKIIQMPKEENNIKDEVIEIWYSFEVKDNFCVNKETTYEDIINNSIKIYKVIIYDTKNTEEWIEVDQEYTNNQFKNKLNSKIDLREIVEII